MDLSTINICFKKTEFNYLQRLALHNCSILSLSWPPILHKTILIYVCVKINQKKRHGQVTIPRIHYHQQQIRHFVQYFHF